MTARACSRPNPKTRTIRAVLAGQTPIRLQRSSVGALLQRLGVEVVDDGAPGTVDAAVAAATIVGRTIPVLRVPNEVRKWSLWVPLQTTADAVDQLEQHRRRRAMGGSGAGQIGIVLHLDEDGLVQEGRVRPSELVSRRQRRAG